jgi:hypothetical protein
MKKISLLSSFFVVLFAVSFVTVANAAPSYTGEKPIYPAVYQAIIKGKKTIWSESKATVSDPNIIVIDHVRISDGLKLADFTLRISLENNVVTYQFSNIMEKLPLGKTSDWARADKFSQSDREQIFTDYFNTEIPKVMENEALYTKAKEAADKSLGVPQKNGTANAAPGGAELNFSLALQNPQNYLLYPAVSAAFTNLKGILGAKTANLRDIDCLDNKFTIQDCVAERKRLDMITYQIKIAYNDNQLTVEFTNIEDFGSNIMQYSDKEIESMPRFDTQKTANQLKAQIEQSLANANAYNSAKKAFLENNAFLKRALVPITKILMDEFTTALFKGGEISMNVSILDVNKNEDAEFKKFATAISAGLYTEPSTSGAFALIMLYTNDASLAKLKKNENVTLSGQFVRMEDNLGTKRIIMTK